MSFVFCGVLDINSHSGCGNDIGRMVAAITDISPDSWQIDQSANFCFAQSPGAFRSPLHGASFHPDAAIFITGDIRLNNSQELSARLGIHQELQSSITNFELVLAAYGKWGEDFIDHLLGNFCFVLWDDNTKKLFCVSDHFGGKSCFYFYDGKKFAFSSDVNMLLQLPEITSKINYNKLTTLLVEGAIEMFAGETWFEHIYTIPAATMFVVGKDGLRKTKYWTPSVPKELSFKNEEAYAEAFREVMFKAVDDSLQCDYPVSALLSGGLDSSSVVSVAAKILEKQNKSINVFAVVLPNENDSLIKDERYYIDQYRSVENVNIHYVTADGKGPFSDLDTFKTSANPRHTSRRYLYEAFAKQAKSLGSNAILDGCFGEMSISGYADGGYAEMLKTGEWGRLYHEIKAYKKLTGKSAWLLTRAHVIKPLMPGFVVDILGQKQGWKAIYTDHCLQPGFAEMLKNRIGDRKKEVGQYNFERIVPNHRKNMVNTFLFLQNVFQGDAFGREVEYRYPLKDKNLVEFCIASPLRFKIKNGYNRNLLRIGLDNILPPEILWRTSKTPFSPDYMRRYRAQQPELRDFLAAIQDNDPVRQIINVDKVKKWVEVAIGENEWGTYAELIARDFVPQAIYLISFLRRFPEFQN